MRIAYQWLAIVGSLLLSAGCVAARPPATATPIPPAETPGRPATPTASSGIGVARGSFQVAFGRTDLGFRFDAEASAQGQPRVIGWSRDGLGRLDLIGPPDNLTLASITGPSSDRQSTLIYVQRLIQVADPDWAEASTAWLMSNVGDGQTNRSAKMTYGDHLYTLSVFSEKGTMSLEVIAK
jgi:hypothetical protein